MKKYFPLFLVCTSTVLVGCASHSPQSYQDSFLCEPGEVFQATLARDVAHIMFNQKERTIPRVRSASGAKYISDDKAYRLFVKGSEALLMVEEIGRASCRERVYSGV